MTDPPIAPFPRDPDDLRSVIRRLPKNDLHVHLDGSLRLETLIQIAKKEGIDLPSFTVDGLNQLLFKDAYASLEEYLTTFDISCQAMQKPEYLQQIAYELALDCQEEGVRYIEVRFAPQLHINAHMDMAGVLSAVDAGLAAAQKRFNARPPVACGQEPPFHYGIIACALRHFGPFSPYFKRFAKVHPYSSPRETGKLASLELARGVARIRNDLGIPIVGFDLAGAEAGHPAWDHRAAYQYAHGAFLHKTVHAGEAFGPESIFQAITELHAERIGHGYLLFDTSCIQNPRIADQKRYVRDLCQHIADRRITIEICLTSNRQTNPLLEDLKQHTFGKMLRANLCTTFCTDNRTVSKTSVTGEIITALAHFDIRPNVLRDCVINGFKRSFFPGDYVAKRAYVRACIDYYDRVTAGWEKEALHEA